MHLYRMLIKLTMLGVVLATTIAAAAVDLALPHCQSTCDKLSIPYPFGTSHGCYRDESFLITCNNTHFNPPKPFLRKSNHEVSNISLEGQLRISSRVAFDCYNSSGKSNGYYSSGLRLSKFHISNTKNKFTVVGCDTIAAITGSQGQKYGTACLSLCDTITDVINGSCSGTGCCQTTIPTGVSGFEISIVAGNNHSFVWDFNPCSYAFVVEDGVFNFSSLDLKDLQDKTEFPVVLDWAIENQTCDEAIKNQTSYACKENSTCTNSENGPGYRCVCVDGFHGNPYLPNACQDINECETLHPCNRTCHNLPGSYNCSCPVGYEGDGTKNGTGCSLSRQSNNFMNIALGISIGLLTLLLGISWLYLGLRQRKLIKLREKCFEQNGGHLLRQQLSVHEGSGETTKIFSADQLKKATNNYDESRILGQGGQGTVYKGILPDDRIVAIKKSILGDQSQVEQFINEVIVLSQINHRNVVKLLGCCLETQVPLLVYEFVSNGTLFDHMHNAAHASIPWEVRLKIAMETAGAISYLHSSASIPIIHRDIKSTNILLDDNYTAKVSDFGASRLIPLDQTQLTTLVQGTLGYLDPEYFHTSQLTQKSDVYSFGVVLVELLTGKVALSFERPPKERNLVTSFVSSMKEDRLLQVLDHQVVTERNVEQLKEVAMLARGCVRVKGEERPTMKEVASELEGLIAMQRHPWVKGDLNAEESEYLLGEVSNTHGGDSTISTAGYDSLRNQVAFEIEGGR